MLIVLAGVIAKRGGSESFRINGGVRIWCVMSLWLFGVGWME